MIKPGAEGWETTEGPVLPAPEGIGSEIGIRGRGCLRQTGEDRRRTVVARPARDGLRIRLSQK